MRRVTILLVLAIASFAASAEAQEYPKGQVFGGFSLQKSDLLDTVYGWQASGAVNMSEHFGVVADFGGQYTDIAGVGLNTHQMLFGPRVRQSRSTVQVFAHSLFGIQRTSLSGFGSSSDFTMGIGGGLDILTDSGFGIRAVQFDWMPTRVLDQWSTDQIRLGFGVVVPLGSN